MQASKVVILAVLGAVAVALLAAGCGGGSSAARGARCSDAKFAEAIAPKMVALKQADQSLMSQALTTVQTATSDTSAISGAANDLSIAGTDLFLVTQTKQPCDSRLRRARQDLLVAGSSFESAGGDITGAISFFQSGDNSDGQNLMDTFRTDMGGAGPALTKAATLIRQATP
jgi:hypothetical protein